MVGQFAWHSVSEASDQFVSVELRVQEKDEKQKEEATKSVNYDRFAQAGVVLISAGFSFCVGGELAFKLARKLTVAFTEAGDAVRSLTGVVFFNPADQSGIDDLASSFFGVVASSCRTDLFNELRLQAGPSSLLSNFFGSNFELSRFLRPEVKSPPSF